MKKKSFALGYSYILESWIGWLMYGTLISGGLSTMVNYYSAETGVATGSLFSTNTMAGFVGVAATFVCMELVRKLGKRFTLAFGCILASTSCFILSIGHSLGAWILACCVIQFASQAFCFGPGNSLIAAWWPRKKGTVLGITTTGLVFAPLTTVMFMSNYSAAHGFPATMRIMALVFLVSALIHIVWIKESPESVGLLPDNTPITEAERSALAPVKECPYTTREILFSRASIFYVLGFGILNMATTGGAVASVPYFMEFGVDNSVALSYQGICNIAGIVGSVALGIIDEKMGPKKATYVCVASYLIGFLLMTIAQSPMIGVVGFAVHMFGGGAFANLVGSILISRFGRNGYDKAWKILYTMANTLRAFCYLAIAQVVAVLGSYHNVYLFWFICTAIALVCVFFVSEKFQEPKAKAASANT